MIFDSVKNKAAYKDFKLLYMALDYLSGLDASNLPDRKTVLVKDKLFCFPVSFVSKPESECRYEAHRNYIDVHCIISGVEKIATADVDSLSVTEEYSADKDIGFLSGAADGYTEVKSGQFMVCFPHDAHKVGMMTNAPAPIIKLMFKIAVN